MNTYERQNPYGDPLTIAGHVLNGKFLSTDSFEEYLADPIIGNANGNRKFCHKKIVPLFSDANILWVTTLTILCTELTNNKPTERTEISCKTRTQVVRLVHN